MRLSLAEIEIIKKSSRQIFGADTHVYLFGSRVYDDKKGGDIDLFLIPNKSLNSRFYQEKIKLLANLKINLGDQKIDIIVKQNADERNIVKKALAEGVQL